MGQVSEIIKIIRNFVVKNTKFGLRSPVSKKHDFQGGGGLAPPTFGRGFVQNVKAVQISQILLQTFAFKAHLILTRQKLAQLHVNARELNTGA